MNQMKITKPASRFERRVFQ